MRLFRQIGHQVVQFIDELAGKRLDHHNDPTLTTPRVGTIFDVIVPGVLGPAVFNIPLRQGHQSLVLAQPHQVVDTCRFQIVIEFTAIESGIHAETHHVGQIHTRYLLHRHHKSPAQSVTSCLLP